MSSVIVAASFDPITLGHINIIDRAVQMFDHVIVGIGINPKKKYLFSLEERTDQIKCALYKYGNKVSVKSYSGLLSDFAYENGVNLVIRGARNAIDFDYEKLLADINQGLNMGLETLIMVADQKLSHISSSAVKELQEHQAPNLINYVPMNIKEALEYKISNQYRIGITGGIGCGKSFVEQGLKGINYNLKRDVNNRPLNVTINVIDMDKIGRYILKESSEPIHYKLREKIAVTLGGHLLENGIIDTTKLLKIIFDLPFADDNRKKFEEIMGEPTIHLVRRQLKESTGIVLISSALFVEMGMCDLVNNNFIFVDCPKDVRLERLKKRGYTEEEIKNRLAAQYTPDRKLDGIKDAIEKHSYGSVTVFNNIDNNQNGLNDLYHTILGAWENRKWKL